MELATIQILEYCEEMVAEARLVVVRLLGAKSCWPYGVGQIVETCAGARRDAGAAAGRRPARPGACGERTLTFGSVPLPAGDAIRESGLERALRSRVAR